jgi:hypothetical protein
MEPSSTSGASIWRFDSIPFWRETTSDTAAASHPTAIRATLKHENQTIQSLTHPTMYRGVGTYRVPRHRSTTRAIAFAINMQLRRGVEALGGGLIVLK